MSVGLAHRVWRYWDGVSQTMHLVGMNPSKLAWELTEMALQKEAQESIGGGGFGAQHVEVLGRRYHRGCVARAHGPLKADWGADTDDPTKGGARRLGRLGEAGGARRCSQGSRS